MSVTLCDCSVWTLYTHMLNSKNTSTPKTLLDKDERASSSHNPHLYSDLEEMSSGNGIYAVRLIF